MKTGKLNPNTLSFDTWSKVQEYELADPNTSYPDYAIFNGSSSSLTVPDSDDFSFGAGNFTLDFKVNFNQIDTYYTFLSHAWMPSGNYWFLYISAGNKINFICYQATTGTVVANYVMTNAWSLSANIWYHISFSRNGTTALLFIDGVPQTLTETVAFGSNDLENMNTTLKIGAWGQDNPTNGWLNGYMKNVRISKDIVRWTSAFTPPTSLSGDSYTKLLLPLNGYVTDYSSGKTVTNNSVTFAGAGVKLLLHGDVPADVTGKAVTLVGDAQFGGSKWGTHGGSFNGSSSILSIPDHADWDVVGSSSDDWTIDMWVKQMEYKVCVYITQASDSPSGGGTAADRWLFYDHGAGITFGALSSSTWIIRLATTERLPLNQWAHLAMCKVGSTYGIYINGIQKAYTQDSSTATYAKRIVIGDSGFTGSYLRGSMDEIRIIKSNPFSAAPNATLSNTIAVPTGAHTSDSNTKLLLHLDGNVTDSGNTGHTVTNTSVVFGKEHFDKSTLVLDGTGDCVTYADTDDFSFSNLNFTASCWFKRNNTTGENLYLMGQVDSSATTSSASFYIYIYLTGEIVFVAAHGSTAVQAVTTATYLNTDWHHVLCVRDGGTLRIFVDGVADGTASIGTNSLNNSTNLLAIGRAGEYTTGPFNGVIADAYIIKGYALYTSAFTTPTSSPIGDSPISRCDFVVTGDESEEYKIDAHICCSYMTGSTYYMIKTNYDDGSTDYYQRMYGQNTTAACDRGNEIIMGFAGAGFNTFGTVTIHAPYNSARVILTRTLTKGGAAAITNLMKYAGTIISTNRLHTISIYPSNTWSIGAGSNVTLYKKVRR